MLHGLRSLSYIRKHKPAASEGHVHPRASFLGLPAEIRNEIYEFAATNTTIHVSSSRHRRTTSSVALLLACRQTSQEYRPILLVRATLVAHIANYDFSNIVRVLEKTSRNDLAALRLNPNCCILFHLSHVPNRIDRKGLREWSNVRSRIPNPELAIQRGSINHVTFHYYVTFGAHMRPPRPASRYVNGYQMKLDLLRTHLSMIVHMQVLEYEPPSDELKLVRCDLDHAAKALVELQREMSEQSVRTVSASITQAMLDLR